MIVNDLGLLLEIFTHFNMVSHLQIHNEATKHLQIVTKRVFMTQVLMNISQLHMKLLIASAAACMTGTL